MGLPLPPRRGIPLPAAHLNNGCGWTKPRLSSDVGDKQKAVRHLSGRRDKHSTDGWDCQDLQRVEQGGEGAPLEGRGACSPD